MSRKSVIAICEGETEKIFIETVLAPYLGEKEIDIFATILGTAGHKGGHVSYDRAKFHFIQLLRQRSDWYVTTLFDFYGLGQRWPKKDTIPDNLSSAGKAEYLEAAVLEDMETELAKYRPGRFLPYFAMHEFEAMLFSDVDCLASLVNTDKENLQAIVNEFEDHPEDINNNPQTAPSKRLQALDPHYDKVDSGVECASTIGIDDIRAKCPHFDSWLKKLETLTADPSEQA